MNRENPTISGLYYRYKRLDDKKIVEYLERIKIVKKQNKGVGTIYGYYPLNDSEVEKLKSKPRGNSLTFDVIETGDNVMTNLVEWKTITFLVKSTSRFFLKPDIGEVFDQIYWRDLDIGKTIKAICVEDGYETLPDTDGEHHLMKATLLVNTEDLEEVKNKMSEAHQKRKPASLKTRKKISKGRIGMKFSETHKENLRKATLKNPSMKDKKGKLNPTSKAIYQCDMNGIIINEFESILQSCEKMGFRYSSVLNCLKNKWKQYKGFTFKYK